MFKRLSIILSILIASFSINGQTFPVVSTTQIIPPYSVYLSDYASPSSDKLMANLYLQDQNQSGIQVKLRITITGDNGIELRTKDEFMPPPITLMGGVQEQISGMDLQAYLEPANLVITGMDPTQFAVSRKLPEGIYQFTIEAVEYRRLKTVSNPGTAVAWLILNDPPIWNLPQHNSLLTATNPQNIFFSWLPLHKGSPNSAFTTEYEFALYDIIPQDRNPDDAVNTGIPIYQSNTMANSLVYGPADPPLEIGRKYACRVKAYDTEGRDMFKNDGYSTVLVFTYGQECLTPVGISHEVTGPFSATVSWAPLPGNTEFILEYREKTENGTSAWYADNTYNNSSEINQLKPVTNYEYKLKALCGSIESDYSILYDFTTQIKESDSIDCGTGTGVPQIDNSPPLQKLYIGDVINVGGFEGIVTQARGSNGVFTGKCIMRLTNFNILLKSHFTDISINESYQVTEGNVLAERGPGIMINLDNIAEEIDSLASIEIERDSIFDDPGEYLEDLEIIYTIDPEIVTDSLAEDLEEIREDLTELSESEDLTEEQINAIEDLLNQIDNLLNGGSNQNQDKPSFVMFKASPDQQYGFDEPNSDITSLLQYYQPSNSIEGKEQLIRWKSVKEGFPDEVYAYLDSINPNLKFYNEAGSELAFQNSAEDTIKIVTVTGTQEGLNGGTTDRIYARIIVNDSTTIDAGVLNIVTYQEDVKELIIIPVNGNSLPSGLGEDQFFELLNDVYGQALIKWNKYHMHPGINFDYAGADDIETFDAWPESGQQYSPDMQALINTYMQNESFDQEHYYVFLVDNPENAIQLGIMPFFQNFAFIYVDKVSQTETFVKTVAHELGHGAFGLLHPFKRHEGIDEFGYENLMTYHPTSTRLHAYQWNLIQYPQWFLEVDYGSAKDAVQLTNVAEFNVVSDINLSKKLCYVNPENFNLPVNYVKNGFITYLNPANLPITLPERAWVNFTAITGINAVDEIIGSGHLRSFMLDDVKYTGNGKKENGVWVFNGYKKESVNHYYQDEQSFTLSEDDPYVFMTEHPDIGGCGVLCQDIYIVSGDKIEIIPDSKNKEGAGSISYHDILIPNETLNPYLNIYAECNEQRNLTLADIINQNGMPLIWEEEQIFSAEFDPWGKGGALYHILANNGHDYYIYFKYDDELNEHYQIWDADDGIWRNYTDPVFIGLADELRELISIKTVFIFFKEGGHDILDIAGMIPGFGEVFDGINAVWYYAEGDILNASLSGAAVIPILGWGSTAAKWVTKVNRIRKFGKIIKVNGVLTKIQYDPTKLKALINRFSDIGMSNSNVSNFKNALRNVENLGEEMLENPQLLDAWKLLDDAGESVAHLTTDVPLIQNLSDDIIAKPELINSFADANLVEAWKIASNAPQSVRTNINVLEGLTNLKAKNLPDGTPLNVQKLFDNGLGSTLNKADDATKTSIMQRLDEWEPAKIDKLADRFADTKYAGLAEDMADPASARSMSLS